MDFEAKISVKGEERGIKIYGCSYEEKGKKKKLEKGKEGSEGRGGSYKVRKRRMVRKKRKGVNKISGKIKEVIGKEKREN